MPETTEEWLAYLKNAPDTDIALRRTRLQHGFSDARAAEQIFQEREFKKKEDEFQRMAKIKQERESEHTLQVYWRLADWSERFGMIGVFCIIFLVGYLCAKESFISRFIDLIRSIKP
jgi:uncharacterized protein YozE (UPF0346 family)